ncbi:MAG: hypothetical protein V3T70_05675, partial [Phycisphaerae bacterium]
MRTKQCCGPILVVSSLLIFASVDSASAQSADASFSARIAQYRSTAQRIIEAVRADNAAYDKLTELCDDIGHRLSGSENLERAVAWAVRTLQRDGQDSVRAEPVM